MVKQQQEKQLSVAYHNVQLSISNTQAFLEWGKQENMDILYVAEVWVGKRGGQEVTAQHPTFVLITEIGEGKVFGYVRKECKENVKIIGEGKGWTAVTMKGRKQECSGIYIQPNLKKEELERWIEELVDGIGEGDAIIMGDFNANHPQLANKQANARANAIHNWAAREGLTLKSKYGIPNRGQTVQGLVKESTLDLAWERGEGWEMEGLTW